MSQPRFGALLALLTLALAAPASARPSAPIRSVSSPPAAAAPGAAFKVVVKARGHARVRLLLSRDAKVSRDDLGLGAATPSRGAAVARVRVPAAASGAYRLLACAGRQCRAAKGSLHVTSVVAGGGQPGSGQPGGGALPPVPTMALLDAAPNPRTVTPTGDSAHAAVETVGPAGGTVQATGADGATYTLVLPAGALVGDTPITLTPVTAISGLPYSAGFAAAVDIGPDGLTLFKPATLTITSPKDVPIADQGGFSWHDGTKELYRLPMRMTREVSFDLLHFSGYGYASMTAAERAIDGSSTPSLDLDAYQQAISEVAAQARQAQLSGSTEPSSWTGQIEQFMVEAYDQKIRPRLVEATTDESIAASTMQLALGWERSVQLMYGDNASAALAQRESEIWPFIEQILRNAYDKTYAKCMAGEPSYGQRFFAYARAGALLGIDLPNAFTRFDQCERYELHVDGDLWALGYAKFSEHTHVDVPIRLQQMGDSIADLKLVGQAQPVIDPWTVTPTGFCAASADGVQYGNPFAVTDLQLHFNLTTQRGPDGRDLDEVLPPDVDAIVGPGTPQEQVLFDCANSGQMTQSAYPLWSTDWLELAPGRDQYGWYHLTGWDVHPGSTPYLSTKIDAANASESMNVTLDLDHTPGTN